MSICCILSGHLIAVQIKNSVLSGRLDLSQFLKPDILIISDFSSSFVGKVDTQLVLLDIINERHARGKRTFLFSDEIEIKEW